MLGAYRRKFELPLDLTAFVVIAREVVRRGIESGELREGLDADVVLDALYGPIYHRLLVPYDDAPLSDEFIDRVVDHVFGGLERSTAGGGHPARR